MLIRKIALGTIAILFSAGSGAASLDFNPGLWETTMTRTNPMTGQPTTETTKECVKEKSFDPRDMIKDADGCQLTDEELSGDTLTFAMTCSMEAGAEAVMKGEFQTDGKTGHGAMNMNMKLGGMEMSMDMNWTAKRLGDC
ncbi:MAG: hypothetical protein DHS20C01_04330 [marine bacterium B5-7]|nr:MAG: hypothetical protein DHS20C01_04330 [marine bacterium B5-7]